MLNFYFYNPTRIFFGEHEVNQLADLIPKDKRILLTFGKESIKKNGLYERIKDILKDRVIFDFGGIGGNPEYEYLLKALPFIKEHNINFLLAVGGGSVIDGTKFIAAASEYEGDSWDLLQANVGSTITFAPMKSALPIGCVLTLPATGSEMNCGAVITKSATKDKLCFGHEALYPQFSILDPSLTYTLPPHQTANGIIDTFVHVTEQYLTYPVQAAVQDRFAEGVLQTLIEEGPKVLENPHDYKARANLMWAATCATNGFFCFGVPDDGATHYLGHELTALFNLDHGVTLAIVLPILLHIKRQQKKEKLLQYAERVWHIKDGSDDAKIDQAIEKTRTFFESLGVKTRLRDYGITAEHMPQLIAQLERHHLTELGEHRDIDLKQSEAIYAECI